MDIPLIVVFCKKKDAFFGQIILETKRNTDSFLPFAFLKG
jgi:hypothetical protein